MVYYVFLCAYVGVVDFLLVYKSITLIVMLHIIFSLFQVTYTVPYFLLFLSCLLLSLNFHFPRNFFSHNNDPLNFERAHRKRRTTVNYSQFGWIGGAKTTITHPLFVCDDDLLFFFVNLNRLILVFTREKSKLHVLFIWMS